ncbi:MAG: hypothetical protein Q9176_000843 [Flavoplaca citrina]
MASQWSHDPHHTGYNQYQSQYGPQGPQTYIQQQPQQYGHQMYQTTHAPYPQQLNQHYPQQFPSQQFPQQAMQQQYPQHIVQHQYPPHQQHDAHHQYAPQQQYEHQQQYSPQQQINPQTQYPSHQGNQYANQYPQAPNGSYVDQSQSQPPPQGCYNCGSPGHWAQACPEPKRELPAGAYNRPPPFKRQKPNPPVVTKYVVPSHVQQQPGPAPPSFGGSYGQQSYPQYQGPPGPPTPQSGHSPHQQWSHQPHQQQYHQGPSQPQQYPQQYQQINHQYQQAPQVPNAPPTPATPYASHLSNHASPQAAQYNGASYFANNHVQSPLSLQAQQMSSASPVSVVAHTIARHPQQQQSPTNRGDTASVRQASRNSSVSMLSMSVTSSPEPVEVIKEENDDDLSKLDVPDIPVVTQGSFASLVDRPLPANFVVADALEPFDPPSAENNGCCQSKYTVIDKLSTFTSCIKETKYWDDMKGDPIFIFRLKSSKLVPIERILATYRNRREEAEHELADLEDGEWTRDTATTVQPERGRDLMDRLEDSLAEPFKVDSATSHRSNSRERKPRDEPSTSCRPERVAPARNVMQRTATEHHWKRKVIRSIPPPPVREDSPLGSPERTPPMRSRTPSMYELNEIYQQEEAVKTGKDAMTGEMTRSFTANGNGSSHVSYDSSDPFEPPPPPAHLRKLSSYDGAADGGEPLGSPNGQVDGNRVSVSTGNNDIIGSYSNGQSGSPSRRRSDAVNGCKREPEEALSDENNTPKRRQADDTKSRLKKRQPKVAAAYR